MNDNTKLEIAKELIASKVGKTALLGLTTNDEELQQLIQLKEEVDRGNMEAIDYVLNISKARGVNNND